jgi:hypothetical protein
MGDGHLLAKEIHRFSHKDISEVDVKSVGVVNHSVEFHCFLVPTAYFAVSGLFDERMTTQEQIHYGLLARHLGATVTFEPDARVTYVAKSAFASEDLEYLSFRWNEGTALGSIQAIKNAWGIYIDEETMLVRWIRGHRIRAYGTLYAAQKKSMSAGDFLVQVMTPLEEAALARATQLRGGKKLRYINPINASTVAETLESFMLTAPEKGPASAEGRKVEKAA